MLRLNEDVNFHFELLRILASARCYGADVAEVLKVSQRLVPGNFDSWYEQFYAMAQWVLSTVENEEEHDRVTLRDAYFRASRYLFASEFFLHGNPDDPRNTTLWESWIHYFDKATSKLDIPPERRSLQADGFEVPIIVFRASTDDTPRPVLLVCNGLDGSMEEMYHFHGAPIVERGYHVVLFEGPGQPTVTRQQKVGFLHDWEKVVTPIVDYVETLEFVDKKRICLLGNSLGGYLAARAACFEHRLAAVMCVDGIFDVYAGLGEMMPPEVLQHLDQGSEKEFSAGLEEAMTKSTNLRWIMEQIEWAFLAPPFEALQTAKKMTLEGIVDQIQCPVFVADAERDIFVVKKPQAQILADALGSRATYVKFTEKESAEAHCHVGATVYLNQVLVGWLRRVLKDV
ncbi:hypothetical protein HRR83_004477 [Exophiala dermatitidis]|uniref:AB hydrolase-1 domain-containing protein n=2 Tax=Exophiala dermatitidis TaxID=5970 RepID=H6BQL5_EXODN|nr:uncharacterized protein HMPREF1120_02013 [Exophiala dermatitidis NIH/UT8656]XP_009154293.1 hypothetical protein, variant [Exophiala dermatitidis NIH/UT8656]KAJ4515805.1 hypothetical protein HRR75_003887 [Exophiala dermatitidis]EHY53831.1 hypothetical protein, variant [Exophiala dermatitidis NIH/UT8656]EHY53832.1 hypothetical protein HMPREF1120_02013 [Exophiala dermatitidis NIH/UT8656]KAJ4519499.1 hypothetical protein HRR74_004243 [Exophiala dermatitidis]KAJ4529316.1 hypothetical protein HR